MSNLESPADWRHLGRPDDDPDGLLRAFFRAELPQPWPAFRRPDDRDRAATPARPRSWTAARSRLALAATVAVLLLGTLLLSGQFHGSTPATRYGTPAAKPYWKMQESLEQEQNQPTKLKIEFYPER
jgi:hypothetical protein